MENDGVRLDQDLKLIEWLFTGASKEQFVDTFRKVREQPGWLIYHLPPPGIGASPILPQIRPDKPVRTRRAYKHWHGDQGQPWPPDRKHCPDHKKNRCTNCVSRAYILKPGSKAWRDHIEAKHQGQNTNEIHYNEPFGKYQHALTPKREETILHDHAEYARNRKGWARKRHVKAMHPDGDDPEELHPHLIRVPDRAVAPAMRLDMHPLAHNRWEGAQMVFLGIEGTIKGDAMLTYILDHDLAATVVTVPSIWQWNAPELEAFAARYLQGRLVYIICDADWYADPGGQWKGNPDVIEAARLLQTRLRYEGIDAMVASPPADWYAEQMRAGHKDNKGEDDHLADDGHLEDLDVVDRVVDECFLQAFVARHATSKLQAERAKFTMKSVALHAGDDGGIRCSQNLLAKVMMTNRRRLRDGLRDLEKWGAITVPDLKQRRRAFLRRRQGDLLGFQDNPHSGDGPEALVPRTTRDENGRAVGSKRELLHWCPRARKLTCADG